ncbi:MAG: AAA family ATPase [Candidatus Melainabacteria bacterium]|nr:MAG: AAA family ATPase [Candidatus Melainabacteria bacterium]
MIKNLYIKNYILIDELNLIFDPKFNAIIGETGAGKSIIISAIDIVFGAKVANKEVIKKRSLCKH